MTFFNYFFPTAPLSAARPPPTLVQTTIHTSLNSTNPTSHHELPFPLSLDPTTRSNVLLLLFIPILWLLAHIWTQELTRRQAREPSVRDWDQAWQTCSWPAFYGLLRLSYDNNWDDTKSPFTWHGSVQRIWHRPNRPWLGRLLSMGVIPLTIQDGGVLTYRVDANPWLTWKSGPSNWFGWPMYVQSKKRACFEFILPRTYMTEGRRGFVNDADARENFLDAIEDNKVDIDGSNAAVETSGYGVTMCVCEAGKDDIYLVSEQNPPASGDLPMEDGVKSPIAAILPFLRDEVLFKGYGTRANNLSMFCRDNYTDNLGLLKVHDTVVVRLEAKHYGQCNLDAFVYGLAEEAGLEVQFPERTCREEALKELRDCFLPTTGLKSFPSL